MNNDHVVETKYITDAVCVKLGRLEITKRPGKAGFDFVLDGERRRITSFKLMWGAQTDGLNVMRLQTTEWLRLDDEAD